MSKIVYSTYAFELITTDSQSGDYLGASTAIDKDIAVLGSNFKGAVTTYKKDGNYNWKETQRFTDADAKFGDAIAVYSDVLLIANPNTNPGNGVVNVYRTTDDGDSWNNVDTLQGVTSGYFGEAVSIDKNFIFVGCPGDNEVYPFYTTDKISWNTIPNTDTVITTSDSLGNADNFGYSIDLDDKQCIIGLNRVSSDSGAAYVFKTTDNINWHETAKLTITDGGYMDSFGIASSISSDIVVCGAPSYSDSVGVRAGAAFIFKSTDSVNWNEIQKIAPDSRTSLGDFANSVSIDNRSISIGSYNYNSTGTVYIYRANNLDKISWTNTGVLVPSNLGANYSFGEDCTIQEINFGINTQLIAGSPYSNVNITPEGGGYIYEGRFNEGFYSGTGLTVTADFLPKDHNIDVSANSTLWGEGINSTTIQSQDIVYTGELVPVSDGSKWTGSTDNSSIMSYQTGSGFPAFNFPRRYVTAFLGKSQTNITNSVFIFTMMNNSTEYFTILNPDTFSNADWGIQTYADGTIGIQSYTSNPSTLPYLYIYSSDADIGRFTIVQSTISNNDTMGLQAFSTSNTEQPNNCFHPDTEIVCKINSETTTLPISKIQTGTEILAHTPDGPMFLPSTIVITKKPGQSKMNVIDYNGTQIKTTLNHLLLFNDKETRDQLLTSEGSCKFCHATLDTIHNTYGLNNCEHCSAINIDGYYNLLAQDAKQNSYIQTYLGVWYHIVLPDEYLQCPIELGCGVLSEPLRHKLYSTKRDRYSWKIV